MKNKYAPIVKMLREAYSGKREISPALDESHLEKIEAQLGYALAKDYRDFLRDYPGFEVATQLGYDVSIVSVPFAENLDGKEGSDLCGFYGSGEAGTIADFYIGRCADYDEPDEEEDMEWRFGLHLVRDTQGKKAVEAGWPKELLPIGFDSQLNEFCLVLFGLCPGAIFFWRANPWDGKQNLYLVADSFDEFMRSLYRSEG